MPFDVGHSTLPSAVNCRSQYASLCTCRSCPILDLSSFICRFIRCQLFVAGSQIQLQLSWSLLSCYCSHCCSCGCSSWLLLRLLFEAAPATALRLLQRLLFWLLLWVLLLATSAGAPFGCLCCALFCYFHERSSGCFYWCSCSPASEDAPTMAAAWAADFM